MGSWFWLRSLSLSYFRVCVCVSHPAGFFLFSFLSLSLSPIHLTLLCVCLWRLGRLIETKNERSGGISRAQGIIKEARKKAKLKLRDYPKSTMSVGKLESQKMLEYLYFEYFSLIFEE